MEVRHDPIYKLAKEMLRLRAKVVQENPILNMARFEDNKILVEGIFPYLWDGKANYELVAVAVKMVEPKSAELETRPFSLPNRGDDVTTVYIWEDGFLRYYRPGKWGPYLESLVNEAIARLEARDALNNIPIEDGKLFPDIER